MNLLVHVYAASLHLYPREFRDEMQITFADSVAEASQYGCFALVRVDMSEILGLIPAIMEEHMQSRDMSRGITRMVTRSLALAIMLSPILLLGALAWYG